MKVNYIIFSILLLLFGIGGCTSWEDPVMQSGTALVPENEEERARFHYFSIISAQSGWYNLMDAYARSNNELYLKLAARSFNRSWRWNPENYNAYWGWGVIRGFQTYHTSDPAKIEELLKQSISFFEQALEHSIPDDKKNRLFLDMAYSYRTLGVLWAKMHDNEKSLSFMNKAKELIDIVLKNDPQNARGYFFLSVHYYDQKNYKMAKLNADKAAEYGYEVTEGYKKDLNSLRLLVEKPVK